MLIGLHDSDKTDFPNYALMKISAWHKAQGDAVEWWNPLLTYDRVYSSKVFLLPRNARICQRIPSGGGRGTAYMMNCRRKLTILSQTIAFILMLIMLLGS